MIIKELLRFHICKNYFDITNTILRTSNMSNVVQLKNVKECVILAKQLIESGAVIAIPTDTIYGLAVNVQNSDAIRKLYEIKQRNYSKPLAICVAKISDIGQWGNIKSIPKQLLKDLLPGPITIVLERTNKLNPDLNPGISKIALRIPKNEFVLKLVSSLNTPIALTSANISNEESSVSVDEFSLLWPQLAAIFDGGTIGKSRTGSTIVDLSIAGKYTIVREGSYLESTINVLKKYNIFEYNE